MRVLNHLVPRKRIMCSGKKLVVPNATMSLAEMLRRFVRREVLPVERKGTYVETDYDLEKIPHMDIVEREELLEEFKAVTAKKKKKADDAVAEKAAKDAAVLAATQSDPKGDNTPDNNSPKQ